MTNLAIIPARSGSKGLKDKNIKKLNSKPLLAYSVEAALKSGIFECVHVSTDSEIYADIAKKYGADVPFLRSELNSSDTAGSWDVVLEVIRKYEEKGCHYDMVTLLQPTSPLRDEQDILKAYEIYHDKDAKAVVGVCEVEHSPKLNNVLPENGSMDGFLNTAFNVGRQQLPTYYRINGAMYMVSVPFLNEDKNIYREGSFAYVMEQWKSIDIDTELDFEIAEMIYSKKVLKK